MKVIFQSLFTNWHKFSFFLFFWCVTFHLHAADVKTVEQKIESGIEKYQTGDLQASLDIFKQLNSNREELSPAQSLQVNNNLGNIYADFGKNVVALKYYQHALSISRKRSFKTDEGKILKNIGALYISWKKMKDALAYYNAALKIGVRTKDNKLIADCYNNLGTVYEQQMQLEKAKKAYNKALSLYLKLGNPSDLAMTYSNLSIVYKRLGFFDKAVAYNIEALNYAEKMQDTWLVAAISNNIGNAYRENKQFELAESYAMKALQLADSIEAREVSIMALETLSDLRKDEKRYAEAFRLLKKMNRLQQEFINTSQTKQFNELEIKYKTKEKLAENATLKLEKERGNRRNTILMLAFVILLLLSLFAFIWVLYRRQKTRNAYQQSLNNAVIASENQERFRIARDLHDSVGQMLSVIKMRTQENTDVELHKLVDQTIREVRTISHNLIPEALNFGLIRALEELQQQLSNAQLEFILAYDQAPKDWRMDKERELSVYRIIQECITNALKYADPSKLELKLIHELGQVKIQITNNGKGFDTEQLSKSKGLGAKNLSARLASLNGSIEFKSALQSGTTILITIPDAK